MRIQQTDRILKESRLARHANEAHEAASRDKSAISRAWKAVAALPARLIRRSHE